jgi:L-malate glycosyltransferase
MPGDAPRLRILMILESIFPRGGGAESQVRTLARLLRDRGHSVTVLTPRIFENEPVVQRLDGFAVCRLPYPKIRSLGTFVLWLRMLAFLRGHGRRYDAWHVHIAHYLGAIACWQGARMKKPVIVKISGWWELERGLLRKRGNPLSSMGRRLLLRASTIQAISHRIETELAAHNFPARSVVAIPNAIDTSHFPPRPAPSGNGPVRVVFVGRMVPEKDLEGLFEAWRIAFPHSGVARLVLIGSGRCEDSLRALARRLDISSQIDFLGHQDHVAPHLADADVGVLPSLIEGLSNTMLELMASCIPVIASRVSGSEDFIVDDRNGWLFEPGNRPELAEKLLHAVAVGREGLYKMGRQARIDVEAAAGANVVVDRLLSLYRNSAPASRGRDVEHPAMER